MHSGPMSATHSKFIPAGIPSFTGHFRDWIRVVVVVPAHEGAAGGRPRVRADVERLKKPSVFGLVVGAVASAPQLAGGALAEGECGRIFPRRVEGWKRGFRRPSRRSCHDPD